MTGLVGRILKNRYRVIESLGRGGMAEVYKVWDTERNATLAMKVLHEDLALDNAFLRRFQREAQTLRDLQHPNIVRFYELDQDGRLLFMLMDYVDGETLKHKIFDVQGPMPFDQVMAVMRPLCQALQYAHNKGYIHADVKPGNVMIDRNGRVMLADFGIARLTESATVTMLGAGTPAYMSPEQARGKPPSPQTDIYALGIILYEMLAGERPFTGEQAKTGSSTSEKIRWEQLNLNPMSPRRFNRQVGSDLDAVVMRCLEKNARARFASPLELLNALETAMPVGQIGNLTYSPQPVEPQPAKPAPQPVQKIKSIEKKAEAPARPQKMLASPIFWLIGGVLIISVLFLGAGFASSLLAFPTPLPTATYTPTETLMPSATYTPMATLTPTVTATPTLGVGSTEIADNDGMTLLYVPEGKFTMGSQGGGSDEHLVHEVTLDAFWIDQTEVTNAMYAKCVDSGTCQLPSKTSSYSRSSYYGNSEFDDYPVIYVNWTQAKTYCEWAGRSLPTEAQWEKAASWDDATQTKRYYPWGDNSDCSFANHWGEEDVSSACFGDTTKAGSYESGRSFYGAYDMAGNVWEWVNDWYDSAYYSKSPSSNPPGPLTGQSRVLRGGSWYNINRNVSSANRLNVTPGYIYYGVGFRCARSLP